MTTQSSAAHVYHRKIDRNERTSLSIVAGLIPPGSTVLDLGTGSGALGLHLTTQQGCTVDGVTYNDAEAELARPSYRRLEVADLESCALEALFGPTRYDAVVCADVLEHIRHPERVLQACRTLLAPGGRIILSVPNAGYCGLVSELMHGDFRYRDEGLLDRTHVKFFTRQSLLRFVADGGWFASGLEALERPLNESEFFSEFDRLPPAVARYLLALPDALTYQFILSATLTAQGSADLAPRDSVFSQAVFSAQLYLGVDQALSEARKVVVAGVIGNPRQKLRFPLPASGPTLSHLRLDPADRPGFLHLYGITLRTGHGETAWSWLHTRDGVEPLQRAGRHQMAIQAQALATGAARIALLGQDPWMELPIPDHVFADPDGLRGGELEVELGWPMSADYVALDDTLTTPRLVRDCEALAARVAELEAQATHQTTREAAHLQRLARMENSVAWRIARPLYVLKYRLTHGWGSAAAAPTAGMLPAQAGHAPEAAVDVIVPVYRGLADTRRCLASVLSCHCTTPMRLVVINDASPEPELTQWLREQAQSDPRLLLLENPQNLGFVATVNRGMDHAGRRDVVLLNSDTEVANNWLDRLRAAAYSDARVASVTPFSNNATICSYPRFCQANPLPQTTTAQLDQWFAQCNAGQVVDIPTAVGFCMYIRRDSLDDVGHFDVENFGKGYGEENDFCIRAAQAGWRNLHALDTYVLHTGGISFGDTKSERELAAMATLRRLHPAYEQAVHRFIDADPARQARQRVDVARLQASSVPVVLAVLHDRGGGTVRHVHELAAHLAGKAVFLSLSPAPHGQLALRWLAEAENLCLHFDAQQGFEDLVTVLRAWRVSHVHYHHLVGYSVPIGTLAGRLGVRYDFTVHDHYLYCPQITLTDGSGGYCGEFGLAQCARCVHHAPVPGLSDVALWRSGHAGFLAGARHVFAPSEDTARRLRHHFPEAAVQKVPHTDMLECTAREAAPARPLPGAARMKVAVLGALSAIKGADILEQVACRCASLGLPVDFELIGYAYRDLVASPTSTLTVHGEYQDTALAQWLRQVQPDLLWFPAVWPETYSYTLSTALQAGLPVLASRIGAFPERLAGRNWTWLTEWDTSPSAYLTLLSTIREQLVQNRFQKLSEYPDGNAPASSDSPGWQYASDYLHGLAA